MTRAAIAPAVLLVVSIALPLQADSVFSAVDGKVYHTEQDCTALRKIDPVNRIVYKSVAEAEAAGLRRCKLCERKAAQRLRPEGPPKPDRLPPVSSQPAMSYFQPIEVEKVTPDGDILEKEGGRICILGVCIPLERQECHEQAIELIRKHVPPGARVLCGPQFREPDVFGRRPAFLKSAEDKPDLGGLMIRAGLAWMAPDFDHSERLVYSRYQTEAWEKGLGIWKRLDGEPGLAYVVTGFQAKSYHPVGCPHARFLTDPMNVTLNEAKARRLTPCDLYQGPSQGTTPVHQVSAPAKSGKRPNPTSRRSSEKEASR